MKRRQRKSTFKTRLPLWVVVVGGGLLIRRKQILVVVGVAGRVKYWQSTAHCSATHRYNEHRVSWYSWEWLKSTPWCDACDTRVYASRLACRQATRRYQKRWHQLAVVVKTAWVNVMQRPTAVYQAMLLELHQRA